MGFYISENLVGFMHFSPAQKLGEKGKRGRGEKGRNPMDSRLGAWLGFPMAHLGWASV
jgi:hypothetical protein